MGILIARPADLLRTLKDSGYKNTSYALAELVDNSIEANAKNITISIKSGKDMAKTRVVDRIQKIGIFDDGEGMDKDIISQCLAIGWGTRIDNPKGLGKFGFGLKGASISMAEKIEIFSWQNGEIPNYTYLDFDEINQTDQLEIPTPISKEIPKDYSIFSTFDKIPTSGTLIIWSNLDHYRLNPKQSATLVEHLNKDMCRIFRHFMDDDDLLGSRRSIKVRLIDENEFIVQDISLQPNDPMYLLTPNNLPGYENEPTNEKIDEATVKAIDINGKEQFIKVSLSVALPEIQRKGGNTSIGKHYASNNGISFVRAGRELELNDKNFFPPSEPRTRWLGIEVQFPPQLDDYFGVTNNKQAIRKFMNFNESQLEQFSQIIEDEQSDYEVNEAKMLSDLHNTVLKLYRTGERIVKSRGEGTKVPKPGGNDTTATIVSKQIKKIDVNVETSSATDAAKKSDEEKLKELTELALKTDTSRSIEEAESLAKYQLANLVELAYDDWAGNVFIDVKNRGNAAVVVINRRHPFYNKFHDHLLNSDDKKGFEALKIMLMALVRTEDVLENRIGKEKFEKIREEWGKYLKEFLEILD